MSDEQETSEGADVGEQTAPVEDTGGREEPGAATASTQERLRSLARETQADNRSRIGTLVLHAALRDISLTVDGDAALRAIAIFAGQPEYRDVLTPEFSSAVNGWSGIDFDQLVAVTWLPNGCRQPGRVTLDPHW